MKSGKDSKISEADNFYPPRLFYGNKCLAGDFADSCVGLAVSQNVINI